MDNLYFVKLPSNVLPSASGNNVVICETQDGKLYWCDSGGKKRLVDVDTAFPVGCVFTATSAITSPGDLFGGSWEQLGAMSPEPYLLEKRISYQSISSGKNFLLGTITVPANSYAIVMGYTGANESIPNGIMNCQVHFMQNGTLVKESTVRTTLENGGGCSTTMILGASQYDTTVELNTYGYNACTIKGTLSALVFSMLECYAWKRIS